MNNQLLLANEFGDRNDLLTLTYGSSVKKRGCDQHIGYTALA